MGMGRHVPSSWVLSSCQAGHIFSLSLSYPLPKGTVLVRDVAKVFRISKVGAFEFKPVCLVYAAKLHKSFGWTIKGLGALLNAAPGAVGVIPLTQLLHMQGRGPHTVSAVREAPLGIWFSSPLGLSISPQSQVLLETPSLEIPSQIFWWWVSDCLHWPALERCCATTDGKHYERGPPGWAPRLCCVRAYVSLEFFLVWQADSVCTHKLLYFV